VPHFDFITLENSSRSRERKSKINMASKPFSPDLNRGNWEKPTDYIFACFGLALKLDIFVASFWFFFNTGSK